MSLVRVPCAICGGESFECVYPGTIDAERDGDAAEYFSSSRLRAGHLPIERCTDCGLVMTNPRDDDATLTRVYASLEDRAYEEEGRNRRRSAADHLRVVERHGASPGRLLTLGCATGIFASVAHEAGWSVTGVDSSAWAIERARERCPGAHFACGQLEEVELPAAGFDVVTLLDVLEHVTSPRQTLDRARGWLVPGGHAVLSLPNFASVTRRSLRKRWVLLLREHLWYFTPATIERLLGEAGFEIVEIRRKAVRFSLTNVLVRLGQYRGPLGALARTAARLPLHRLSVRFWIGEMYVIARSTLAYQDR